MRLRFHSSSENQYMYIWLMGMILVSGVSYGAAISQAEVARKVANRAARVKAFLAPKKGEAFFLVHVRDKDGQRFFCRDKFILDSDPILIRSTEQAEPDLPAERTILLYQVTAYHDSWLGLVRTYLEKDPSSGTLPQLEVRLASEDTLTGNFVRSHRFVWKEGTGLESCLECCSDNILTGNSVRLHRFIWEKGAGVEYLMLPVIGKIPFTHTIKTCLAFGGLVTAAALTVIGLRYFNPSTRVAITEGIVRRA